MREKPNLWRLYSLATAYGVRPSDFVELETDLARWQLDEACLVVGRRVENNVNSGKDMWHGFGAVSAVESSMAKVKGAFRSARQKVMKKMKIPENGIW